MKSYLLVGIQFSLIIFLAWYGGVVGNSVSHFLLAIGVILGLWAVLVMRFRVSVLPDVQEHQTLIVAGPYCLIRHPMYTAVLLVTLSWVLLKIDAFSITAWLLLLGDLMAKINYEEKLLRAKFPEYDTYTKKTMRLIPWIY
ncbi:MAG: isoprenylcysteine carboxylmethyltransferase family protein [Candidatus Moranbacteria bacterium]|nr:isoprenylcysteine carboxylmethyltransferase family protein [Candidatus Moranbacteria bacterium]